MELLQLAGEGRSELLRDDHMLVWEVLHAVWCWFESFFIALTTKWLNHSFYNCWLKVNLQFLFFFVNFSLEFFSHLMSFCSLIFFCSVGFHRQLDVELIMLLLFGVQFMSR
jgi:hypothetical protein